MFPCPCKQGPCLRPHGHSDQQNTILEIKLTVRRQQLKVKLYTDMPVRSELKTMLLKHNDFPIKLNRLCSKRPGSANVLRKQGTVKLIDHLLSLK